RGVRMMVQPNPPAEQATGRATHPPRNLAILRRNSQIETPMPETPRPGPFNLITDVAGLRVGHAQDQRIKTGTTVLISDRPFCAGLHIMGGAPGTRDTDLLHPVKTVEEVDALVLSGGSAFGLDAP